MELYREEADALRDLILLETIQEPVEVDLDIDYIDLAVKKENTFQEV